MSQSVYNGSCHNNVKTHDDFFPPHITILVANPRTIPHKSLDRLYVFDFNHLCQTIVHVVSHVMLKFLIKLLAKLVLFTKYSFYSFAPWQVLILDSASSLRKK